MLRKHYSVQMCVRPLDEVGALSQSIAESWESSARFLVRQRGTAGLVRPLVSLGQAGSEGNGYIKSVSGNVFGERS